MGKGFKKGRGGRNILNFKVVGGTTAPSNPKENTIWVNTDQKITSWYFGANEPNVYDIQLLESNYPWELGVPFPLCEGDILNFTIPATVTEQFEAIRLQDSTGKEYYVRQGDASAVTGWPAWIESKETKVGVRISNDLNPVEGWVGQGTAYLMSLDSYYHEEGLAWILTGAFSPAEFNALKKNGLQVYPISAKQNIGGEWVDKTAKSHISGVWADWMYYVFQEGVGLCNGHTGFTNATVTPGLLTMTIQTTGTTTKSTCNEKIDVTNFNTVTFEGVTASWSGTGAYSHRMELFAGGAIALIGQGNESPYKDHVMCTDATFTIDLSSITGEIDLGASYYCSDDDSSTATITIKNIYFG